MADEQLIKRLAKLAVAKPAAKGDADAARVALTCLMERAGIGPVLTERIFSGEQKALPVHVSRLIALQSFLERERRLSDADEEEVLKLARKLRDAVEGRASEVVKDDFQVPLRYRKGALRQDVEASVTSAVALIEMIASEIGAPSLADKSVLDVGCGVKFTQAFYGRKVPVRRYHGVDVDKEMVEFLTTNVSDPRFSYKHIDVYNEMYNKGGEPLGPKIDIGAGEERFDVIGLFSVFTHLAPHDYGAMLALTRRYAAPGGHLVFTTFIDETIEGDFKDFDPARPLLRALYREDAVRKYVEAEGWRIKHILPPGNYHQHAVICTPV